MQQTNITNRTVFFAVIASVIAGVGVLSSWSGWQAVEQNMRRSAQQAYAYDAMSLQKNIQHEIDGAITNLVALTAFFNASGTVSLSEFQTFVKPLLARNNSIQALEWIPKIRRQHLQAYEQHLRALGYASFTVSERRADGKLVPVLLRDDYYPVAYVEPFFANRAAHGFDLQSNATRKMSLSQSRSSGELVSTAKIKLVQELGDSYGFLSFSPVYQNNKPLVSIAQREQALLGFVLGVFRIETLVENALARIDANQIQFNLYDLSSEGSDRLFGNVDSIKIGVDQEFIQKKYLRLPQRKWLLLAKPTPEALQAYHQTDNSMLVLWGGIGMSILLGAAIFSFLLARQRARMTKLLNQKLDSVNAELEFTVKARTQELETSNQSLLKHIDELKTHRNVAVSLMQDAHLSQEKAEKKSLELERSNMELDEFAYIASHDLKSPLRGIDQIASWIAEDLSEGRTQETSEHLALMRNRVQRMEQLLSDLLAYSKVGRREEKKRHVDAKHLIQDLFLLLSPPALFKLQLHGDFPSFKTLAAPFEQVLRNLLNNAIKHHHRDNGVIGVSCKELDDCYEFSVQDDGLGISKDHHELIFKMFKSLKSRDEVEGSGMGLALIKKIADTYGGGIRLISELNSGTTFYFTWPKRLTSVD